MRQIIFTLALIFPFSVLGQEQIDYSKKFYSKRVDGGFQICNILGSISETIYSGTASSASSEDWGLWPIWQGGQYPDCKRGFIDLDGNEVIPCEYEEAMITDYYPFIRITKNGLHGMFNLETKEFAESDGKIFKEYCTRTLGIPSRNIKHISNATLNQMRSAVNWGCDMAKAFDGDINLIFYYAGHGIPNENDNSSYLLPTDGISSDARSAYSLEELYKQLGESSAKQVTVFMDACFSGTQRDGKMFASSRGAVIKAKQGVPRGNMVVFSASQGDETAYPYAMKKHGMFTYFLLKKLQETKGNVTLNELGNYITKQVKQHSMHENGKLQTPTMQVSPQSKISINTAKL